MLTIDVLKVIVADACETCPAVRKVGIVGSFARGTQQHASDVDLVVDVDKEDFSETLNSFGRCVEQVLDYQFNKRLDVIRYEYIVDHASVPPKTDGVWYCQEGFREMLRDLRWIYER